MQPTQVHCLALLLLIATFCSSYGFQFTSMTSRRFSTSLTMKAPKPTKFPNTKAGKAVIFERTTKLIENSDMMFSMPIDGVSKEKIDLLRNSLPQNATATVIKNAILRKAVVGTKYESLVPALSHETMYFFADEANAKATYDAVKAWQNEHKRTEIHHLAKACVREGQLATGEDVDKLAGLPSRTELMTRLVMLLKSVPNRLRDTLQNIPYKLVVTLKAMQEKMEQEAAAGQAGEASIADPSAAPPVAA